jgi:hypothetical protein
MTGLNRCSRRPCSRRVVLDGTPLPEEPSRVVAVSAETPANRKDRSSCPRTSRAAIIRHDLVSCTLACRHSYAGYLSSCRLVHAIRSRSATACRCTAAGLPVSFSLSAVHCVGKPCSVEDGAQAINRTVLFSHHPDSTVTIDRRILR